MKVLLLLCSATLVFSQTKNSNGNPTGEIGSPAFDEIVVHSTLNVRGKSAGSREAKALTNFGKPIVSTEKPKTIPLLNGNATQPSETGAVLTLKRSKRVPRRQYNNGGFGGFGPGGFPSSSSSSAQASSNAFNQNTPFGSFGASASQSSSQSQGFGPHGFQAAAGQSASQTYRLPNGNQIDVSFSGGYSAGNKGGPSFSQAHSVTVTRPNGSKHQIARRR